MDMKSCDSTLSWDGILCRYCRQLFDEHIVRVTQVQNPGHQGPYDEDSELWWHKEFWWHTLSSLKSCAMSSCELCKLTLCWIEDTSLKKLEEWQVTLVARFEVQEHGLHRLMISIPEVDPRPEPKVFNPSNMHNYLQIAILLQIQDVPDYASLQGHEISSDYTDSDETWEQITAWMKSCKSHETCTDGSLWQNKTAKVMPTRLLELAHGESHPLVKLVKTAHIKVADISYATLSHFWGSSLPVKLLTSLVEDFSSGISWASLSRTFRDTIMTTLKLGIRYLWIDALCIIQDSNDDWTYEAATMAGVYTNSYLCIAADASEDGSKGLFRQRSPNRLRSFIVPHQKSAVNRSGSVIYTDRWWTSVLDSPLASRAWSVQERFLAPRVLHFAGEEVHWECTRLFTAESLPVSFNTIPANKHIIRKSLLQLDLPAEHRKKALYQTWYQLVSAYSSGELTFTSDRPIAIAGLARIFCQLLELPDSAYLCGIFRPRLEHDLMWYSQFKWTTPPETIRVADVPSWSWLSICARIWIYTGRLVGDTDTDSLITAEVVRAISTPCHDVFGPVKSSELTLRAPLCQTIIRRDDRPSAHDREDHTYVIHVNGSLLREDEHFMFRPDDTTILACAKY